MKNYTYYTILFLILSMTCTVSFGLSLIQVMKKENLEYGYGCHDAKKLKNCIDTDKDGKISDSEFSALVKKYDFNSTGALEGFEYRIFSLTVCRDFMSDFDADKNGAIDKNEYKKIVLTMDSNSDKKCCKEEIPKFFIKYNHCAFQCIDSNKDGKVSEAEWCNAKNSIKDMALSFINSSCSFSSYLKNAFKET